MLKRLPVYPLVLLTALLCLLSGCSLLQPRFEKPTVQLTSIRMAPAQGMEQRFTVGLRVVNPNASALPLRGISYTLNLQGFDLANGVASQIAPIPAYGETTIYVDVVVSLLSSLRLVQSLLSQPLHEVNYRFNAKLDIGHALLPSLRVSEQGVIALQR